MKITYNEAEKLDIWEVVAKIAGINIWAVNEGLLDKDQVIDINLDKAKEKSQ